MSENSFHKLNRPDFVALKKQFVHPSSEVSERDQLIGRDQELELFRNALERRGNNIFVWGKRGVGKTSLAHTSINTFSEIVYLGPLLACENHTTKEGLF
ncbi:ATP-binding protein, partial [Paracoccus sp. (in: a-proteobacteria)]|uniref:ATP-binding protein n=1 Tax=Paracoccus sp. TaxID=267 RepID=UPI0035AF8423